MEPALSAVGTVVRTSRAVGYVLCCCVSRSAGPHPLAVAVFGSFSVSSSPPVRPWCLPLFTNILISNIFIYDIDDYEYFFFLLSLLYFYRDTTVSVTPPGLVHTPAARAPFPIIDPPPASGQAAPSGA